MHTFTRKRATTHAHEHMSMKLQRRCCHTRTHSHSCCCCCCLSFSLLSRLLTGNTASTSTLSILNENRYVSRYIGPANNNKISQLDLRAKCFVVVRDLWHWACVCLRERARCDGILSIVVRWEGCDSELRIDCDSVAQTYTAGGCEVGSTTLDCVIFDICISEISDFRIWATTSEI